MRDHLSNKVWIIPTLAMILMLSSIAISGDWESGSYRKGYGSYGAMGQNPDEIINYGRDMMRYGFHETGMPGGNNNYPGYYDHLSDETIKKLNSEQESFIRATEDLRQTIYEKELYLKAELVKRNPDTDTALSFRRNISEAKGKFVQKMIEHIIRMKKINLEAEGK